MCYISACRQGFTDRQLGEIASRKHSTLRLAVTLLTTVQTLNGQTNERTSQRFGKIKRGATPPTSQRTVAPHLLLPQPH